MHKQTPSQTVGPFFHIGLMRKGENVLVDAQTTGQRIRIVGTVFDGDGQPVPDALLEIWQADANGFFNHPVDPNCEKADKHFRGFGRSDTVEGGHYKFETIKPGSTPGRGGLAQAPYINVRLFSRGMLIHATTRLYFSDEAGNAADPLLHSIEPGRRETLIAVRDDSGDGAAGAVVTYRFDIHMQGERETVFFEP